MNAVLLYLNDGHHAINLGFYPSFLLSFLGGYVLICYCLHRGWGMDTFGAIIEGSKQFGPTVSTVSFSLLDSSCSFILCILDGLISKQWLVLELDDSVVSRLAFVVVLGNYSVFSSLGLCCHSMATFLKAGTRFGKLIVSNLDFVQAKLVVASYRQHLSSIKNICHTFIRSGDRRRSFPLRTNTCVLKHAFIA